MIKYALFFISLLLLVNMCLAQTYSIYGKVKTSENNELVNAEIFLQEKNTFTKMDDEGNFQFDSLLSRNIL